jgi:hypothetical protein
VTDNVTEDAGRLDLGAPAVRALDAPKGARNAGPRVQTAYRGTFVTTVVVVVVVVVVMLGA